MQFILDYEGGICYMKRWLVRRPCRRKAVDSRLSEVKTGTGLVDILNVVALEVRFSPSDRMFMSGV